MKGQSKEVKISANEINRYMYCPYQWYYKKTYGNKGLQEQYKALGIQSSNHENHYTKGMKYHSQYHKRYYLKHIVCWIVGILVLALVIRLVMGG